MIKMRYPQGRPTKAFPVYFMHGNRDFMIGHQEFANETGVDDLARPLPGEHVRPEYIAQPR